MQTANWDSTYHYEASFRTFIDNCRLVTLEIVQESTDAAITEIGHIDFSIGILICKIQIEFLSEEIPIELVIEQTLEPFRRITEKVWRL